MFFVAQIHWKTIEIVNCIGKLVGTGWKTIEIVKSFMVVHFCIGGSVVKFLCEVLDPILEGLEFLSSDGHELCSEGANVTGKPSTV